MWREARRKKSEQAKPLTMWVHSKCLRSACSAEIRLHYPTVLALSTSVHGLASISHLRSDWSSTQIQPCSERERQVARPLAIRLEVGCLRHGPVERAPVGAHRRSECAPFSACTRTSERPDDPKNVIVNPSGMPIRSYELDCRSGGCGFEFRRPRLISPAHARLLLLAPLTGSAFGCMEQYALQTRFRFMSARTQD